MAARPAEALARLPQYNSDFYDANANPFGLADFGHVSNFPLALGDFTVTVNYVGALTAEVEAFARQTADDRRQTGEDRNSASQSAAAAATFDPANYYPRGQTVDTNGQAVNTRGGSLRAGDVFASREGGGGVLSFGPNYERLVGFFPELGDYAVEFGGSRRKVFHEGNLSLAGEVVMLPGGFIPAGRRLLKLNGAVLSRASYPELWSFAQAISFVAASEGVKTSAQFGPGNGATTFTLPDWRGYFVRAWDDGRGIDPGRGAHQVQTDAIRNITGSTRTFFRPGVGAQAGALTSRQFGATPPQPGNQGAVPGDSAILDFDASLSVPTAPENRPVNLAALYAIRF